MKNPFEEKRKNDRINALVRERDDLRKQLADAVKELDWLRTQDGVWGSIAETNKILEKETHVLVKQLHDAHKVGYNQAVWDVTHFLTDKQKEADHD